MKIPLSRITYVGNEELYSIDAIKTRRLSGSGDYITRFEKLVARKTGRKYCLAVANGTMALELVLRGMGISPGDEVIIPALTFASPAASVMSVGASPVFVDISAENWTIDPREVEKAISPNTKAIIAVDILGHPCDYDKLKEFGIPIIEDAAEAHGAKYKGRPVGSFGKAAIFSFHANKTVTTGEGGCVLTDCSAMAAKMRMIMNHGMSAENRYWHVYPGRNFRMTNLTAAIGTAQTEKWDTLINLRNQIALQYDEVFRESSLSLKPVSSWAKTSCWLYTLYSEERDRILNYLNQQGVDARAIWYPLPDCEAFKNEKRFKYDVAQDVARKAFWLPTFGSLSENDQNRVIQAVLHSLHYEKVN